MSVVALVPARGGSRGIPGKNVKPICGRPLIYWSLRALERVAAVDRIVVTTDCPTIRRTVLGFRLDKVEVFDRDPATATADAPTDDAIFDFVERDDLDPSDTLLLVRATAPLTRRRDFVVALDRFEDSGADSLVTAVRSRRFLWTPDGTAQNHDPARRPRRDAFEGQLTENEAFYIARVGALREAGHRLPGRVAVHEMPAHTAVALDELDDWDVVEALMRRHVLSPDLASRNIRLVLSDVDGVMTDGGVYVGESGEDLKLFHARDGAAIERLRAAGFRTGIVTGEITELVSRRADAIGADHVHQGIRDKLATVEAICESEGIELSQCCYIGDDVDDLAVLGAVGLAACPADAIESVRRAVHYVCERGGGEGCVRELADLLIRARRSARRNRAPRLPAEAVAAR